MIFKDAKSKAIKEYIKPTPPGCENENTTVAENCVFKDGKVTVRPGLSLKEEFIYSNDMVYGDEVRLDLTDCYVYVDGKYGRVAVTVRDNLLGVVDFYINLVAEDGSVERLGMIEFASVDFNHFGYPDDYVVFNGPAVCGCGIFLIVHKKYQNGDDFVLVYELNKDKKLWTVLSGSELYVPTVLANGRGEKYFSAKVDEKELNLPDPVKPEGKNLLSSRFYCYYTADSTSSAFSLPYSSLDSDTVYVEYKIGSSVFSWSILPDTNKSQTLTVDGVEVYVLCNRNLGLITFSTGELLYAPAYTGKLNNIKVTASKTNMSDMVRVASKKAACKLEGEAVDAAGTVTLLYGGRLEPSEVFWSSPVHPLYFSERNFACLGEGGIPVTKMLSKDNRIFAIKENKVFSAKIPSQKTNLNEGFVTDQGAQKDADIYEINFENAHALPEKPIDKSIVAVGEDIFYVGMTGRPYRVSVSSSGIIKPELVMEKFFDVSEDSFALGLSDGYVFFTERQAWLIKPERSDLGLCHWSFPMKLIGGTSYLGNAVLFSLFEHEDFYYVNPTLFGGDKDRYWKASGNGYIIKEDAIECEIVLKPFGITPEKRRLFRIRADAVGNCTFKARAGGGVWRECLPTVIDGAIYLNCPIISQDIEIGIGLSSDSEFKGFAAEYMKTRRM